MNNPILKEIAAFARDKLVKEATYCGVASSSTEMIINSELDGKEVLIKIEIEKDKKDE